MEKIKNIHQLSKSKKVRKTFSDTIAKRIKNKDDDVTLTHLQEQVVNDHEFWNCLDNRENIIIQGETSAGKTLVAEIATEYIINQSATNTIIYLVPLKAMVTEKYRQLKKDFEFDDICRVYASSSDYQNTDDYIVKNEYTIAIIVYEKFFALLAQESEMLSECKLVIVDELQMLSDVNRGPKLEFALTKIMIEHQDISIMGMTTTNCDTTRVSKWLKSKNFINYNRATPLKEHIIDFDGFTRYKLHDTNNTSKSNNTKYGNYKTKIEGLITKHDKRNYPERDNLVLNLLKEIYGDDNNKNTKVLIFIMSKKGTRLLAKKIAMSNVFNRKAIPDNWLEETVILDDSNIVAQCKTSLWPYGVAYHNASLSLEMREFIERKFQEEDSRMNIVVATETLTIGLNQPTDVVIIYDSKVYNPSGKNTSLEPHKYKNFIGRAGRLGIKNEGKSYLLQPAKGFDAAYERYIDATPFHIESSLREKENNHIAPYFLNMMARSDNLKDHNKYLAAVYKKTLLYLSKDIEDNQIEKLVTEILEKFKKYTLCYQKNNSNNAFDGEDTSVELTLNGKAFSPYALSIDTCGVIITFFSPGVKRFEKYYGLREGVSSEQINKNNHVIEIIYLICKAKELVENNNFKPKGLELSQSFSASRKAIIRIIKDLKNENKLWDYSRLAYDFKGDSIEVQHADIIAAIRAYSMQKWLCGESIRKIEDDLKKKGIDVDCSIGDINRIAETISYILDAASKYVEISINDRKLSSALYRLSNRIKYGMNDELVKIANCHVFGITRNIYLSIYSQYKKSDYQNLPDFIVNENSLESTCGLNEVARDELVKELNIKYMPDNPYMLISSLLREGSIDNIIENHLKILIDDRRNDSDILESFVNLLFGFNSKIESLTYERHYISWSNNTNKRVYIYLLTEEKKSYQYIIHNYNKIKNDNNLEKLIILDVYRENKFNYYDNCECIVINPTSFAEIYMQFTSIISSEKYEIKSKMFFDIIMDLNGVLSNLDKNYIRKKISNYTKKSLDITSKDNSVYMLYDNAEIDLCKKNEVLEIFDKNNINYKKIGFNIDTRNILEKIIKNKRPIFCYKHENSIVESKILKDSIEKIKLYNDIYYEFRDIDFINNMQDNNNVLNSVNIFIEKLERNNIIKIGKNYANVVGAAHDSEIKNNFN